jgi:hypothetical protein
MIKQLLKKYNYHFLIILIGLFWISIFDFLTQMSSQGIIYPDSSSYVESAKNLYVFYRGHNYRPILMAIINGFPYLFGSSDETVLAFSFYVNIFCWLAFFVVLFEIFKDYLSPKYSFLFTFFSILFLGNTAFLFHLLTENIYMFFIVLGFYFLINYYKKQQFWLLSVALSIFILSMLIKPGSKFLAIVFTLYFIKEIYKNYKSRFTWLIYGSLFLVFIQCAGVKYQFGNFTLSYIDTVTYYNYIGSKAMFIKYGKEYQQMNNPRAEYIFSHECKIQKEIASADLKQQLQYNTLNLIKAYFSDVIENSKTGNTCIEDCKNINNKSYFEFWKQLFYTISKWQNRVFTILGFCLALFYFFKSYKKEIVFSFISFFILYIMILSGISCGQGDRFHVITFPFVVLLLAKFLSEKTNLDLRN